MSATPSSSDPGRASGAPRLLRHQWGDPVRFVHKTERQCCRCGLVKVTRHEGDEHWTEFWQDAEQIPAVHHGRLKTPACVAIEIAA